MEKHIHVIEPDEATIEQFEHCCSQPYVTKAALMPDAHSGYVAPVGSVLITKGYVVPSWVGYDIGCGMTSVHLKGEKLVSRIKENADAIFAKVKEYVPMGKGRINDKHDVSEETRREFRNLVKKYMEGDYNKEVLQFLQGKAVCHLGSLGDGNHFIEMGFDDDNEAWVTVHSGSRGVGFKVAERYMKKSANNNEEYEATHPLDVNSQLGKEYRNVLDFGLSFALLNRMEMIKKTVAALSDVLHDEIKFELWVNKNHNHAIPDGDCYIHRKGATPAQKDERGVIPANMRDGCFLVEGFGNPEFLESSSHGAGRKLSRTQAREQFNMDQFKDSMQGITGTVTEGTIDEAPMAYKDIYDVMEAQKESVRVVKHIKPLINWKGERGRGHMRK